MSYMISDLENRANWGNQNDFLLKVLDFNKILSTERVFYESRRFHMVS